MELDAEDMEVRKVHIYPDGHRERADTTLPDKDTWLAYEPTPPVDEINSAPSLKPAGLQKRSLRRIGTRRLNREGHDA